MVERPFRIGKALGLNPNISIFISSVFQNLFQKPKLLIHRLWFLNTKNVQTNPNISIFFSSVFQTLFQKPKESSLDCKTKEKSECRGCSSVVECPFRIGKALGSNPNISILMSSVFQNLFQKPKECRLNCKTKERRECRGCSSVVERPFRIRKAFGSNPNISIFISSVLQNLFQEPKECSLNCKTKERSECRRCSLVVECPFRIGKALHLNPNISTFFSSVFKTFSKNLKRAA